HVGARSELSTRLTRFLAIGRALISARREEPPDYRTRLDLADGAGTICGPGHGGAPCLQEAYAGLGFDLANAAIGPFGTDRPDGCVELQRLGGGDRRDHADRRANMAFRLCTRAVERRCPGSCPSREKSARKRGRSGRI